MDAESWASVLDKAVSDIAKQKDAKVTDDLKANEEKELANVRENELAAYWLFVTPEEKGILGKIAEADYVTLLARVKKQHSDKVDADFTAQQNQIKLENEKKLAAQGDKGIYDDLVARLKAVAIPEVNTDVYKAKVANIANFINGLK